MSDLSMLTKYPLVTAIMPTKDRPNFVQIAIEYFIRQDYPNKQLIIAYEKETDLPDNVRKYPEIRLIRTKERPLGGKRNYLALSAKGEIIIHFDDDDWYAPSRIRYQVAPIISNETDATVLMDPIFFDTSSQSCWECSAKLYELIFERRMNGCTLAYRRDILKDRIFYPEITKGESIQFIEAMMAKKWRVKEMHDRDQHIYLRHKDNTWAFKVGEYLIPEDWKKIPIPGFFKSDSSRYEFLKKPEYLVVGSPNNKQLPVNQVIPEREWKPSQKVSCILVEKSTKEEMVEAIQLFKQQFYPAKELIIVEDRHESLLSMIPREDKSIRYVRLHSRRSIGAKMNLACRLARGSVIQYWSGKNWVSTKWLMQQIKFLETVKADITGLSKLFISDVKEEHGIHKYQTADHQEGIYPFTICHTKQFWAVQNYSEDEKIESNWLDISFSYKVAPREDLEHFVAFEPTAKIKEIKKKNWEPIAAEELPYSQ